MTLAIQIRVVSTQPAFQLWELKNIDAHASLATVSVSAVPLTMSGRFAVLSKGNIVIIHVRHVQDVTNPVVPKDVIF